MGGHHIVIVACLLLCAGGARAQEDAERPWANGVAPEQQEQALTVFREGNELFAALKYAPAFNHYRQALDLWDHPAIHYNAAVALINLDKPLSAYKHLERALAYGEAPLGHDNHTQALLYKKLLAAQLAELHVVCKEPGAQVMLDGELLFTAPGESTSQLSPGAHQLVARKPGLLTESRALQLPAGQFTHEQIELFPIKAAPMRSVRRWSAVMPWIVLGSGALIAAAGVPFALAANSSIDAFDRDVNRLCPSGCRPLDLPESAHDARSRARTESGVSLGLFIGGGVIAATGMVLMMMNQSQLVPLENKKPQAALQIRALVGPGAAGLHAELRM